MVGATTTFFRRGCYNDDKRQFGATLLTRLTHAATMTASNWGAPTSSELAHRQLAGRQREPPIASTARSRHSSMVRPSPYAEIVPARQPRVREAGNDADGGHAR